MENKKWYIALRGAALLAGVCLALSAYCDNDLGECVAWAAICANSVLGVKALV